jgi:hypothetical protein
MASGSSTEKGKANERGGDDHHHPSDGFATDVVAVPASPKRDVGRFNCAVNSQFDVAEQRRKWRDWLTTLSHGGGGCSNCFVQGDDDCAISIPRFR